MTQSFRDALAVPLVPPLLVLDLDGTLVDSVDGLMAAANRMLDRHELRRIYADELRPMIGDGLQALAQRILLSRRAKPDDRAVSAYVADYSAHADQSARLFPGIETLLHDAAAAGWRLAVCTNKPAAPARMMLDALGIGGLFAAIGGGDSFPSRKPDPAHLLGTVALARGLRQRAVLVGDHRNDVAAARGAGLPAIFAGWGYGSPDMRQGAAAVAEEPGAVLEIARRLVG